jgi:hypothetical protein
MRPIEGVVRLNAMPPGSVPNVRLRVNLLTTLVAGRADAEVTLSEGPR